MISSGLFSFLAAAVSAAAAVFAVAFYYRCRKRPVKKREKFVFAAGLALYAVFVFVWGIFRNFL